MKGTPAAVVLTVLALGSCASADVWTPNPSVPLTGGTDYADRADPKAVMRIVGTPNGGFSGVAVIVGDYPTENAKAVLSDLKLEEGEAVIPASAVEVRYAVADKHTKGSKTPFFDTLAGEPPAEAKTQPVWVTVNIPKDAAPGLYEGTLTVGEQNIPLHLTVCGWVLPDPIDYTTFVDFIQSPESVALHYKAPLWSDEHMKMVSTCFRQIAKVGNKTLYLHLSGKSNFGNEETHVRWIKGKDGSFTHDFSPAEKYLDAFIKEIGRPKVIVMYDWEPYVGGGHKHGEAPKCLGNFYTLYDPKTKKTAMVEGPIHSHGEEDFPKYPDDYKAFWKPVFDGLWKIFQDRKVDKAVICHGLFKDGAQPSEPTVKNLLEVAPWALWADQNHGSPMSKFGVLVGYDTTVWKTQLPGDPYPDKKRGRTYGWKRKNPRRYVAMNDRDIWKPGYQVQLVRSRLLGELNIAGSQVGFGRMGLDFWPVIEGGSGKKKYKRSISARFPESSWSQLNMRVQPYISPGPNGALGTIRFEMLREGIQECEARIFIERALLDEAKKAKLGGKAKELQNLLDERVRFIVKSFGGEVKRPNQIKTEAVKFFYESDWQTMSKKLYDAAAEVAKLTSEPEPAPPPAAE